MFVGYLCMNIDHGIMPAATKQIQDFLGVGQSEIGLLGSLVYMGNAIGSIVMTPVYQHFNPKYVVSFSILLNIVTLISFTVYKSFLLMSFSRIFAGIF
jgi:sugar phosphate permease